MEAVPEKMDKEIKELEKKIRVLENRKKEEEQKLSAVLESEFVVYCIVLWFAMLIVIVEYCL